MAEIIDFFLHLDKYIETLFTNYQTLSYFILCLILFCETGLVFTPFLPGDSLLFAAGATIAKIGVLNIWVAIPLMIVAVFLGDNVNYFIGNRYGTKLFETKNPILKKLLKKEYLQKTEEFYATYGGRTVVLARFVPIIRTFAPFVAGLGGMDYKKYLTFAVFSSIGWVTALTLLGYLFGQTPFVQNNFEVVILGVVFISILPVVIQYFLTYWKNKKKA